MTEEPAAHLMGEVVCQRIRAGEPTEETLLVTFLSGARALPPALLIFQDWNGSEHLTRRTYAVRAHRWAGTVCTVTLERTGAEAIPPGGDRQAAYTVSVGRGAGSCTCRGFTLAGAAGTICKHMAALAFVLAHGELIGERTYGESESRAGETDPRPARADGETD